MAEMMLHELNPGEQREICSSRRGRSKVKDWLSLLIKIVDFEPSTSRETTFLRQATTVVMNPQYANK
jgi:hypothetical protein